MNDENLYYRRSEISDQLAYLAAYAPDFPAEDRTSLEKQRAELAARIMRLERDFPDLTKHPRFPLFKIEVGAAFDTAAAGGTKGTRLFRDAAERFEQTSHLPPRGPDFIAGPCGITPA